MVEKNITVEKEKENIKALITDISHQLKTPLASIKMFNSLLLEEGLSNTERVEFLKGFIEELLKQFNNLKVLVLDYILREKYWSSKGAV